MLQVSHTLSNESHKEVLLELKEGEAADGVKLYLTENDKHLRFSEGLVLIKFLQSKMIHTYTTFKREEKGWAIVYLYING